MYLLLSRICPTRPLNLSISHLYLSTLPPGQRNSPCHPWTCLLTVDLFATSFYCARAHILLMIPLGSRNWKLRVSIGQIWHQQYPYLGRAQGSYRECGEIGSCPLLDRDILCTVSGRRELSWGFLKYCTKNVTKTSIRKCVHCSRGRFA